MQDEAARLTTELLRLADEQDAALVAADWESFISLAERRAEVVTALDPLLQGRQDLLPVLQQVEARDQSHQLRLREASDQVQQEIGTLRPQQVAMHAYFAGVAVADVHEARFIDSRDGSKR